MKHSFGEILLLGLLFCACARPAVVATSSDRSIHLEPNRDVYVVRSVGDFTQENAAVQKIFYAALRPYASRVLQSEQALPFTALPQIADTMQTGYIFYPQVTRWEDHNTPWTTVRDKVSIEVVVLDAQTGRRILRQTIEGKSKLWVAHNENPDVVAQQLVKDFVKELFK